MSEVPLGALAHFDISFVDTIIPLHSSIISPVNATATRNLVLVRKTIRARHGGNRDFADFHVVPFGSNIVGKDMYQRASRND